MKKTLRFDFDGFVGGELAFPKGVHEVDDTLGSAQRWISRGAVEVEPVKAQEKKQEAPKKENKFQKFQKPEAPKKEETAPEVSGEVRSFPSDDETDL